MAHVIKKYKGGYRGPYPSRVGDFCGNGERRMMEIADDGITIIKRSGPPLSGCDVGRFRIGRPSDCKAGTSDEMATQGFVGVYLAAEREPLSSEIEVDTDELQEEVVSGQRAALKPFNLEEWAASKKYKK